MAWGFKPLWRSLGTVEMQSARFSKGTTRLKEAWAARSSFLDGIEEQTDLLDECDVVVPVTKIPDYVLFADQLAQRYDFRLQYFGHAGDGNLHIYTCSCLLYTSRCV